MPSTIYNQKLCLYWKKIQQIFIYEFPTSVGHCPGNWGYRLYQNRLEPTFLGANIFWEDTRVSENAVCGSGAAGYARHNFPLGDHSGQ